MSSYDVSSIPAAAAVQVADSTAVKDELPGAADLKSAVDSTLKGASTASDSNPTLLSSSGTDLKKSGSVKVPTAPKSTYSTPEALADAKRAADAVADQNRAAGMISPADQKKAAEAGKK
jgi:hypothetical protein